MVKSLPTWPLDWEADAEDRAARALLAVTKEAVIGTPLRTNGCKVCGEGSGSGYCGDHLETPAKWCCSDPIHDD